MKKLLLVVLVVSMMLVSGCQKVSDLFSPSPTPYIPMITPYPIESDAPIESKNQIFISRMLKMTNDWTIIGDFDMPLTGGRTADRVVLGTSAEMKNGQIMWDDTQYWTIAVLNENGAYNLFSQRMSGQVYMEVGEAFVKGVTTPMITAYIFSGADREIRNYVFTGECFEETIVYTTKEFSTAGVNCLYSTLPESDPK